MRSPFSIFLVTVFLFSMTLCAGCGTSKSWEYNSARKSALDNAVHKATNNLVKAPLENTRNLAVVEVSRTEFGDDEDQIAHNSLRGALLSAGKFTLVADPKNRRDILNEIGWSVADYVDPEQAVKVGRIFGADSLIYGNLHSLERHTQLLQLKLLHVEQGKYPWGEEFTGYPYRSKSSAVGLSIIPVVCGGQHYNFRPRKGLMLSALETAGIITTVIFHVKYSGVLDDYEQSQSNYMAATKITEIEKYRNEADDLFDSKKTWRTRRNWVSIFPALVYAYSILDAYWDARNYQQMRSAEY